MKIAVLSLLLLPVVLSSRLVTQEADKLVKIPLSTDWTTPYSSLTCLLQIGGQIKNLTAGTNALSISVVSTLFNAKNGYDQSKSKTSSNGPIEISSYKINNAYLAGINDRTFKGQGVSDMVCPQGTTQLCKFKDGIEFFRMDDQISGDRLSSLGRLGLDTDPTSTLKSYG